MAGSAQVYESSGDPGALVEVAPPLHVERTSRPLFSIEYLEWSSYRLADRRLTWT